jgi:hypothetical protein
LTAKNAVSIGEVPLVAFCMSCINIPGVTVDSFTPQYSTRGRIVVVVVVDVVVVVAAIEIILDALVFQVVFTEQLTSQ